MTAPVRQIRTTLLVVPSEPVPYRNAVVLQESYVRELAEGDHLERLILLEHPHVITLGRGFHARNLLFSREWLAAQGVAVEESGRGGDVTYHGPGQIVGYPIMDLSGDPDLHRYLRNLEEWMIRAVADFGVTAGRKKGLTGIWVGDEKLGAIGVRVARWISSHGVALNVNVDLKYFGYIIPCGIKEHGVTSLHRVLGQKIPTADVRMALVRRFEEVFGRKMETTR
jgi:lipoyl(octanoyl) transferase